MAELDENERRIINEFGQLQEKSKQLFNGLRYVFVTFGFGWIFSWASEALPILVRRVLNLVVGSWISIGFSLISMVFLSIRDLPQYGHKQWQAYFGRTFDVYTKLWKFQQQHRHILDIKYDLKRWQIGEIASKIGQLYYHY